MPAWLAAFAYRTPVTWTPFVFGVAAMVVLVTATIAYHTLTAAKTKPAEVLKSE